MDNTILSLTSTVTSNKKELNGRIDTLSATVSSNKTELDNTILSLTSTVASHTTKINSIIGDVDKISVITSASVTIDSNVGIPSATVSLTGDTKNKTLNLDLKNIKGETGRGITIVSRTSGNGAVDTVDTYTITYTDDTTSEFKVTNGTKGTKGDDGYSMFYTNVSYTDTKPSSISKQTITANGRDIQVGDLILSPKSDVFRVTSIEGDVLTIVYVTSIKGERGTDGTSVKINGTLEKISDLESKKLTATNGDGYIIGGFLYVYTGNGEHYGFSNVGEIKGPQGDRGASVGSITLISSVGNTKQYAIDDTEGKRLDGIIEVKDGVNGDRGASVGSITLISSVGNTKQYAIDDTEGKRLDGIIEVKDGADGKSVGSVVLVSSVGNTKQYAINDTEGKRLTGTIEVKDGANGDRGASVGSVVLVSSVGNTKQYAINDTEGKRLTGTIEVKDGANGEDGNGIDSITRTSSVGLEDTYTISYTKSSKTDTFTVTNGIPGNDGYSMFYTNVSYADTKPSSISKQTITANGRDIQVGDLILSPKSDVFRVESINEGDTLTIAYVTSIKGERGNDGTSVNIIDTLSSTEELESKKPSASKGDGYIIGGYLYVYTGGGEYSGFSNVGEIKGPKGDTGDKGDRGASVKTVVCVDGNDSEIPASPSDKEGVTNYYRIKDTDGNFLTGTISIKNGENGEGVDIPIVEDESGKFIIIDDQPNNNIGLKLDSEGLHVKDVFTYASDNTTVVHQLSNKADKGDVEESISGVNERLSSIENSSVTPIIYNDLVNLRNKGLLIPGRQYKIIDYVTTTSTKNTKSAGHQFDIIVTALNESTLSEEAKASISEKDSYFRNNGSNLSAWKIWYCLDNDTSRFEWAGSESNMTVYDYDNYLDTSNCDIIIPSEYDSETEIYALKKYIRSAGISVINNGNLSSSFMRDERILFGNCTYTTDSKERKHLTLISRVVEGDLNSDYTVGGLKERYFYQGIYTIDDIDYSVWAQVDDDNNYVTNSNGKIEYVFTKKITKGNVIRHEAMSDSRSSIEPKGVIYRMIDEWGNDCPYDFKNIMFERFFNNYSFEIIKGDMFEIKPYIAEYFYTFNEQHGVTSYDKSAYTPNVLNNIIKPYRESKKLFLNNIVFNNDINDSCCYNTFANDCLNNTFGGGCVANTFGDGCQYNIFGRNCMYNTFGSYCYLNILGNDCAYNHFDINFMRNYFGNECIFNHFGTLCLNNTLDHRSQFNTFSGMCENNTFGTDCILNNILNRSSSNYFGDDCGDNNLSYSFENIFGNSCVGNILSEYNLANIFGENCMYNTLSSYGASNKIGDDSCYNTFGVKCHNNVIGIQSKNNTFGNGCEYNELGDYYINNSFGNGCSLNSFRLTFSMTQLGVTLDGSPFNARIANGELMRFVKNVHYGDGCKGVVISLMLAEGDVNEYRETVESPDYCFCNYIVDQGLDALSDVEVGGVIFKQTEFIEPMHFAQDYSVTISID